jgi:hypothetical protein
MSRQSSAYLLRRAYEHLTASAAAIALTLILLMTVNAHAGNRSALIPSVTIQVPTVEIEVLDADTASHVAAPSDRVNG